MSGLDQSKKNLARSGKTTARGGLIAGAPELPQVNLLPTLVRQRRALRRIKGWLLVGVGVVLVLLLGAYVMAMVMASTAEDELQTTQAETQRLLQEQAKYAEVPQVLGQIADATAAQTFGMGTEVLWSDYVLDVIDALPKKAKLTSFVNMTVSPIETAPLPTDQLLEVGIGTVTLAHRSPTVPDITEWLEALSKVEGFTDPHASVAQIAEDDGDVYYEVTTTVQVLPEALSGRYLEEGNKQ